jgi:hypothetical protein
MLGRLTRSCAALAIGAVAIAGCAGSSAPDKTRQPPDLAAFLRLPVATPSSCPRANGEASGRRSPWVGYVDISVYVARGASPTDRRDLHDALAAEPHVAHVYTETAKQAVEEFQRLYTCSAQVSRADIPASYRLVLDDATKPQRDALVRAIYRLSSVDGVSCDPSSPCVDIRPSG